MLQKFFDEMGLAWNESEKGPPISIMIREHVPRARKQSSIPPGIHDKDLEARKPSKSPSIASEEQNMQNVLEIPIMFPTQESVSLISTDICRNVEELLVMMKQVSQPG